jgi:hypothetical protein
MASRSQISSAQKRWRAGVRSSNSLRSRLTTPARYAARSDRCEGLMMETGVQIGPPDKYPKGKLIQDDGANMLWECVVRHRRGNKIARPSSRNHQRGFKTPRVVAIRVLAGQMIVATVQAERLSALYVVMCRGYSTWAGQLLGCCIVGTLSEASSWLGPFRSASRRYGFDAGADGAGSSAPGAPCYAPCTSRACKPRERSSMSIAICSEAKRRAVLRRWPGMSLEAGRLWAQVVPRASG